MWGTSVIEVIDPALNCGTARLACLDKERGGAKQTQPIARPKIGEQVSTRKATQGRREEKKNSRLKRVTRGLPKAMVKSVEKRKAAIKERGGGIR